MHRGNNLCVQGSAWISRLKCAQLQPGHRMSCPSFTSILAARLHKGLMIGQKSAGHSNGASTEFMITGSDLHACQHHTAFNLQSPVCRHMQRALCRAWHGHAHAAPCRALKKAEFSTEAHTPHEQLLGLLPSDRHSKQAVKAAFRLVSHSVRMD